MINPTAVSRLALWKAALSFGAVAAASLAFAGAASAATCVTVASPDGTNGTDNLAAAITAANNNGSCSTTTLILSPGVYTFGITAATPQITKNLNIVGSHAGQASGSTPAVTVQGSQQASRAPGNLFSIAGGVTVNMEGFEIISGGGVGFSQIDNAGNLTLWGMALSGGAGAGVTDETSSNLSANESTFASMNQVGLVNNGTMALNSDDIVFGASNGVDNNGTYTMNDVLLAQDSLNSCVGIAASNGGPGSMDDDGSCAVAHPNNTSVDGQIPLTPTSNGGPTLTYKFPAGSVTVGAGVNCPTTDTRFFVNPSSSSCDIGAVTNGANQQTTAPGCVVTNTNEGATPPTQQVSASDAASGIGPEAGSGTDNPSNTLATAYPPPAAVPVPGDSISNLQINNGSVMFTPTASPSTSPLVLTATKTTTGQTTQWSFTALNWAGVAKNCF